VAYDSVTATLNSNYCHALQHYEAPAIAVQLNSLMVNNRLINPPEIRIFFQSALRFLAFMDNVVVRNERDSFRPSVSLLQVLQ